MKKLIFNAGLPVFLLLSFSVSARSIFDVKAVVEVKKGKVTINSRDASVGSIVKYGDVIETGEKSLCRIVAGGKTAFDLKENSMLVYKLSKSQESSLELSKGWLAGMAKRVFTKNGRFEIRTPTMTAAIRGTSYCLKVENNLSTYFCVCNGTIDLKSVHEENPDTVSAEHHTGRRFRIDGDKSITENAGLLYHGDSDLELLAEYIGEKIDWTSVK